MPLRVVQLSTRDIAGGAEAVALNLHQCYRAQGLDARLIVGSRARPAAGVAAMRNGIGEQGWRRWWWSLDDALDGRAFPGLRRLRGLVRVMADPARLAGWWNGAENFRFPGSWHLLEQVPDLPDVVHAHNLHGAYFDLRALPWISHQQPVVLTLHDTWLLSGHCAYAMDCDRWLRGCGHCPDLVRYPPVLRDATAQNWQIKGEIYQRSRLYVAAPSRWLLDKVQRSNLVPALAETRLIPYGVDLEIFRPADQAGARRVLGLPPQSRILLLAGNRGRQNVYKDYATIEAAFAALAGRWPGERLLMIALGSKARSAYYANAELRYLPREHDPRRVAAYFQAADIYVHAAQADNFPCVILEAMACGTPVVATAVGGIPEQVEDGITGYVCPPRDAAAMAQALRQLLGNDQLRVELGRQAATRAADRFDLQRQVQDYLDYYEAARLDFKRRAVTATRDQ